MSTTDISEGAVDRGGCYPYGFFWEFKALFKLAWPTSLAILFHYLVQPISLMMCGHLGKLELAGVALGISVIYITTVSFGRGLAFAGDTFFSQTFGSHNNRLVGVYLQKGILLGILGSFPVWGLLLNAENILLLLGQDPPVAKIAAEFALWFFPGVVAYYWVFMLMRFLLCQNIVIPNLVICIYSAGANVLLNYVLVYVLKFGIKGSAVSLAATYYIVFCSLAIYVCCSKACKETWQGWSRDCLTDWGPFVRTGLSSVFMTFILWLYTEAGTYLSGILGPVELSAFSIMFQVEGFAWMIPLGLGSACASRLGQFLGANDPTGAVNSVRVALTLQLFISILMALAGYLLRVYIPMAFTQDETVRSYTTSIMYICAIYMFFEGLVGVGLGIIRGTGRQLVGVVIVLVASYVISLPIGISLMFLTSLRMPGLWWGYIIGLFTNFACFCAFMVKLNWWDEADKAQIRSGVAYKDVEDDAPTNNTNANADEQTRLLNPSSSNESDKTQHAYLSFSKDNMSWTQVITRRLLALFGFSLFLVAGILVKLFVKGPPTSWSLLCIPINGTLSWNTNVTTVLPICNQTTLA